MDFQAFSKLLFANESVSESLWNIAYGIIAAGMLITLTGFWAAWSFDLGQWYWYLTFIGAGLAVVAAGFAMIEVGEKKVPADPPHKALVTIWGERQSILLEEGDKMTAPYWPLKIGLETVLFERANFDFPFDNVVCRSTGEAGDGPKASSAGGTVYVKVSVTIGPDDNGPCVKKYLNNGGRDGVRSILQDQVSQSVREIASKYDWETFTFMKNPLTVLLLSQIAQIDFHQLERNDQDLIREDMFRLTVDQYRDSNRFPKMEDPMQYLFPDTDDGKMPNRTPIEKKRIEQEIEIFLRIAREACFADVMDLGIEIFRLNVTHIEASASLKEASNQVAKEEKERQSETRDTDTNIILARRYVAESGGTVTFAQAMQLVHTDKGRATRTIVESSGNPFMDAVALFANSKK